MYVKFTENIMEFYGNELEFLVFQARFLVRFLSSYYNRNAFANVHLILPAPAQSNEQADHDADQYYEHENC